MGMYTDIIEQQFGMSGDRCRAFLNHLKTTDPTFADCKSVNDVLEEIGIAWYFETDDTDGITGVGQHESLSRTDDVERLLDSMAPFVEPDSFIRLNDSWGQFHEWRFDGRTRKTIDGYAMFCGSASHAKCLEAAVELRDAARAVVDQIGADHPAVRTLGEILDRVGIEG